MLQNAAASPRGGDGSGDSFGGFPATGPIGESPVLAPSSQAKKEAAAPPPPPPPPKKKAAAPTPPPPPPKAKVVHALYTTLSRHICKCSIARAQTGRMLGVLDAARC